jgi:hypothetical protein
MVGRANSASKLISCDAIAGTRDAQATKSRATIELSIIALVKMASGIERGQRCKSIAKDLANSHDCAKVAQFSRTPN